MSQCERPQQSHYKREPQALDSGRNSISTGWGSGLHKGRCPEGLSSSTPDRSEQQTIGDQHTHKGRYWFKRISFGTKMSKDVFQMKMGLINEKCPGVISIHDNLVIYGMSNEDHDANHIKLLNGAQLEGLVLNSPEVLNSKKLELKQPKVSFFSVKYSAEGKSLTDTETRYANTECELLAIVFACQRFNTYILRRPFTVV